MLIDPYRLIPIPPINITDHTITASDNAQSTAGVRLLSTGVLQTVDTGSNTHVPVYTAISGEWQTTAGSYEARVTVVSGVSPGDSTAAGASENANTWLSMGSNRTWWISYNVSAPFTHAAVWTLEIRDASTLAVLDTCTLTVTANGIP